MIGRRVAIAVAFAATATLASPGRAASERGEAADPAREILVMLRLPPDHLRPGVAYGGGWGDAMSRGARLRIVARLARENRLEIVDDWPMGVLGLDCFVLVVPDARSPADVAQRLAGGPEVAWSQPMSLYQTEAAATHNDPLYPAQPAAREWRLAALHQTATGRGVRVAVIDSAIEATHPDLLGQVELSRNFAPAPAVAAEQHGTGVAGVIAAIADNRIGIAGVAPRARLLSLRACWQLPAANGGVATTSCDSLSLGRALDFAISHDAQVINLSLAGPPDVLLGRLIDAALARRIAVVAAFDPALPGGGFPASHPGVIAVADESEAAAPSGVYAAPGRDVPTTAPGGRWTVVSGSSFAAAHVSGLAALVRERRLGSSGLLQLAAARPGNIVDACATLLGAGQSCAAEGIREAAAGR